MKLMWLVCVLAILLALGIPEWRHLTLKIPEYGFIVYYLLGGELPPWIDTKVHRQENHKYWLTRANKDPKMKNVVVFGCIKCGTTLTLNTLHHIRMRGEDRGRFEDDLLLSTPWFEFQQVPGQKPWQKELSYFATLTNPGYDFQVFKSHAFPKAVDISEDAKYLVVMRNPLDCLPSYEKMMSKLTYEYMDVYGGFAKGIEKRESFYKYMLTTEIAPEPLYKHWVEFTNWIPYCKRSNFMCLHFADMRRDFPSVVDKIDRFVGANLSKEQKAKVVEHSSLEFMKAENERFSARISPLWQMFYDKFEFVQTGEVNKSFDDDFLASKLATMKEFLKRDLSEPVLNYMMNGGEIPV